MITVFRVEVSSLELTLSLLLPRDGLCLARGTAAMDTGSIAIGET